MITTKQHLHEYLKADAALYSKQSGSFLKRLKNSLVTQPINAQNKIWRYVVNLRYSELYYNNSLFTPPEKVIIL